MAFIFTEYGLDVETCDADETFTHLADLQDMGFYPRAINCTEATADLIDGMIREGVALDVAVALAEESTA